MRLGKDEVWRIMTYVDVVLAYSEIRRLMDTFSLFITRESEKIAVGWMYFSFASIGRGRCYLCLFSFSFSFSF